MNFQELLNKLFPHEQVVFKKQSTYIINNKIYHCRYKTDPSSGLDKFAYNINNSTLKADFELIAFGEKNHIYIVPSSVMKEMYEHPNSYVDRTHPKIRAYTLDTETGEATYAKPGVKQNFSEYKVRLKDSFTIIESNDEELKSKYASIGGEGSKHLNLKEFIARNPNIVGINDVLKVEIDCHTFPSMDRPDIVFWCKNNKIFVVEIEIDNCLPGAYQAIKYRSLMSAEQSLDLDTELVSTVLVARNIKPNVKSFCNKYKIKFFEINTDIYQT